MTFKKGHIEICLTTEDGIQHLRCHGWLKRERILVKAEQVFGKGSNDFGMFIIVIPGEELYELMDRKDDMFSLAPENKIDIDDFISKANEATLKMFKTSNEFRGDYVMNDFMTVEEKINDLNVLIEFFEQRERYEDCGYLLQIKDKIKANEEFKTK